MKHLWLWVLVAIWGTACIAREDSRYLLYSIELNDGSGWIPGGGGCMSVDSRGGSGLSESSTGGDVAGEYSVTLQSSDGVAELIVVVRGVVTVHRTFDETFYEHPREETIMFDVPSGQQRYHFQAASSCDALSLDAGPT